MSGSFSRAPAKENGDLVEMPPGWRFRASVRADDIFVYCLSSPPTGPRPKEAGTKACSLRFWSGFAYLSPSQASMLNCPRNRDCRGSEQTPRPLRRGFFFSQMVRLRVEPGRSGVRYLPGLEHSSSTLLSSHTPTPTPLSFGGVFSVSRPCGSRLDPSAGAILRRA
jgi:hypothetical protein